MTPLTTREERAELASTVRQFLARYSDEAAVRRAIDSADGFDRTVWQRMAGELGLQGLAVPEEFGGAGFGASEQLVVMTEIGRSLLCSPYFASAVCATSVVLHCGDEDACQAYLPGLVDGTRIATLAPPAVDGGWQSSRTACRATDSGDGVVVRGEVTFVPWANVADLLLITAAGERDDGIYVVEGAAAGVTVVDQPGLDPTTPLHRVRLQDAPARRIGPATVLDDAMTPILLALSAEATGVARQALDSAVEYAKVREQFGRVIGSFQAIKQRCADMLLAVEAATSTASGAASAYDADAADATTLGHLAAAQCLEAAVFSTTENIEVHGGIGFTWEHSAHLYYKRAMAAAALYGSPADHRRLIPPAADAQAADDILTDSEPQAEASAATEPDAEEVPTGVADDEQEFAREALAFLAARAPRRQTASTQWGVGEENLALFHESSGEEERDEADRARAWQRHRWDAGFGWITGPERFGGRGLPARFERLYRELEGGFDVADMNPLRIGLSTVGHAISGFGSDEQIGEYGAAIQRGDVIACQLFSEPEAGSDLAGVRTRAVRHPDGWHLDGQKVWTSNGTFADLGLALVRTDADVPKHRGLTMMLVPMDAPGVEVRPLRQMTGGSSFCEVFLTDVVVPDSMRIGDEGAGWKVATTTLAAERRSTGDRSHETTARAVALLWQLAQRSGRADDPQIRDAWARTVIRARSSRFQQIRMQAVPDSELTGAERAIDKLLLVQSMRAIGELAQELLGPAFVADTGEWGTFGWNRWLMGALGYRIAGGTDEILRGMLAERVLGLPRDPR